MTATTATTSATDADFTAEVLDADLPVLVDFWAEWCPPCKMIAPVLEQIAAEYAGRLKVVKVDIDQSTETARAYGILSAPTLNLYKGGEVVAQIVGARPKRALLSAIEPHL
ncbi:thioredoxin [Actinocorallia sp. A-T 12471]|uniref:thioredoxin n=1 Tax=Actinocorallia sp. A-T 12471 TaxID=3089813 RepID=UPI0029D06070|nr:thioredoxin [Actinocorallia sp. A-T 12471]MDX6744627.1 thioredoxin [Actinocorallia sp. A-T 12471]